MFKRIKEALSPPQPLPVIHRAEDDLPPELKYAERPGRSYRVFPQGAQEKDIIFTCLACGNPYDGVLQTHCRACAAGRAVYKIDVTDQPYYTLPPEKEGEAPVVNADELIPSFGGPDIQLGNNADIVFAHGNKVTLGPAADVLGVAGNDVSIGPDSEITAIVAKNSVLLGVHSDCQNGLTAKEITLRPSCTVGWIVVPDGGVLRIGDNCDINTIYLGQGATIITGNSNEITIDNLIILGDQCRVNLGNDCTIGTIETNYRFSLSTGNNYANNTHGPLTEKYNLVVLISEIVNTALGKDH